MNARACWVAIVSVFWLSCFPGGDTSKKISGKFSLLRTEANKYYVVARDESQDDMSGVLNGTITKIGWNSDCIVAYRKATVSADPDGWMTIDVTSGRIEGPFSESVIRSRPQCSSVVVRDVEAAMRQ